MKIVTWNVNGLRAVGKKGFAEWIKNSEADVVCIQETKAEKAQLTKELISPEAKSGNYFSYFSSAKKKGYSGTALYSLKEADSTEIFGEAEIDDEGRVVIAKYGRLAVISAYFPNSQDGGKRLDYKLSFCAAMKKKCDTLVNDGFDIVLLGDYNIAHTEKDLANPKANEGNPGFLPEERAWIDEFTKSGYVDTFRHFCSDGGMYTWWSYRFHAREKNIGWRIDYACVNDSLLPYVKSVKILSHIFGSDHCPVEITLFPRV